MVSRRDDTSSRLTGRADLVTFDMGGTSTDIALLQGGEPMLTAEKTVGLARVALPSLDIHTLGAGGGSIARVDAGGILHVGPESAGADPGPACYGKGGTRPTVTDANLVRGLLDPANFLGGRIRLDVEAARRAVATIARTLDTELLPAAEGVARVVNTNMAEGIKLVSVRRGVDPRGFTLVAFGGAAGLHVTEVARLLEIRRVIVPSVAAVLSAWGMLATDLRYELVALARERGRPPHRAAAAPALRRTRGSGPPAAARLSRARWRFAARSTCATASRSSRSACRWTAWTSRGPTCWTRWPQRFHRRHEELYAYSAPGQEVVIVNARVAVVGRLPVLPADDAVATGRALAPPARRRVWLGGWQDVPVYRLDALPAGHEVKGPALFESATTTVLIRDAEQATVTPRGWLDIQLG